MPCHLPGCFTVGIDPIALRVGQFAIYWYGVLIAIGFVVGVRILLGLVERERIDPDQALSASLVAALFGLLAARLFWVLTNNPGYFVDPKHIGEVLSLSTAGLSFFGGIVGALFGTWLYASRNQLPFARLLDLAAVAAPVGQAIGRVGNLINGDERGLLTKGWGVQYTNITNPFLAADRYARTMHPLALYQLLWDVLLFGILLAAYRRMRLRPGQLAGLYLVGYAVGDIVVSAFSAASPTLFGLKTGQLLALVLAAAGLAVFLARRDAPALSNTAAAAG